MIWFLRIAFGFVILCMLAVTGWASSVCALWSVPHDVLAHPWFIATLFDCYFGFLTFYTWLAYKETSPAARFFWLIAILLLGNLAMASYVLSVVCRLPPDAPMTAVLLRREKNNSNARTARS
jgi:hypothetical protein